MKTIWIIDHYSSAPCFGGIRRQYDFARELSHRGYNVVIISSGFSHFTHTYISEKPIYISNIAENANYVYLKTTAYTSNSGRKRAVSMFSFMFSVIKNKNYVMKTFGKPDAVVGCSVHPLAWVAAYRIAKKYKARYCVEVRDLWPRIWVTAKEKKKNDPMVVFFGFLERWAYKHADKIIYSMSHGDKYICDELGFAREKAYLIGQPMNCESFDKNANNVALLPNNIQKFIQNGFVCSFAGYYMEYEGVYVMLEAAKILQEKGIPIKMVFIGSGEEKNGMEEFVKKNSLSNVIINGRIAKDAVPALLSRSAVCMAHLEVRGHPDVYKYGVSKNKVNEYLYSGACTLYGFLYKDDVVATSGGGFIFEPYNAEDLAKYIEKIYFMTKLEREEFGKKGREYIKKNNSVEKLTDRLIKVLFN